MGSRRIQPTPRFSVHCSWVYCCAENSLFGFDDKFEVESISDVRLKMEMHACAIWIIRI